MGHAWSAAEGQTVQLGLLNRWVDQYLPLGLALFFALSGFLLYRPFAAAIIHDERLPLVDAFLKNRALRILPAYWVILAVVGLAFGAAVVTGNSQIGYLWSRPGLLVACFGLLQEYYPRGVGTGIGPAWSLCVEVCFYLTLPVTAITAARVARGRSLRGRWMAATLPGLAFALMGLVGNIWAGSTLHAGAAFPQQWGQNWHSVLERSFITNVHFFAAGSLAAVLIVLFDGGHLRTRDIYRPLAGFATVALGLFLALLSHEGLNQRVFDFLMSDVFALAILYVTLPSSVPGGPALRILTHPWAIYLGTISYSVYLWHEPVMLWLQTRHLMLIGKPEFAVDLVIILAVVVLLSSVTYRFVEAPANARKRRMTPVLDDEAVRVTEEDTLEAAP